MADTTASAGKLPMISSEQAAIAFGEIARAARAIGRFAVALNCFDEEDDDPRDREAYAVAVDVLAAHAGLIADRAAGSLGWMVAFGTEPEDWQMPPAWHEAAAKNIGRGETGRPSKPCRWGHDANVRCPDCNSTNGKEVRHG